MRRWMSIARILCYLILLFFPGLFVYAESSNPLETPPADQSRPMVIKSDSLVVDDAKKIVIFTGQVNAKKDDFTIDCDKMVVYYKSANPSASKGNLGAKITKIVAEGDVKIHRRAGGVALARRAVYYQDEERVVLTGDPMVKQGEDFVQGDKITIFLKENRSIVESSQQRKVKAVIYPKRETK